ncbi:hypothetical protein ACH427_30565 [Streptomyces sp. NPDC020379]|uniref:hypothetical protein n=1 Tax=Streptomyces sp. NPDC020379 TaxID=3365071 RepID=UPI00379BDAA6
MSVLPVIRTRYATPHVVPAVRALFGEVVRRVAAGAVDSPVLQVLGAPAHAHARTAIGHTTPRRPRAHWRTVTGPGGRERLKADWRLEP